VNDVKAGNKITGTKFVPVIASYPAGCSRIFTGPFKSKYSIINYLPHPVKNHMAVLVRETFTKTILMHCDILSNYYTTNYLTKIGVKYHETNDNSICFLYHQPIAHSSKRV